MEGEVQPLVLGHPSFWGQCHVLGLISGMSLQQYIEFLKEQGHQSADAVSKADAQFRLFMEEKRLQRGAEAEEDREEGGR